ncbi:MAG: thioredoxin-disulfide reductase [Amoebophilaceae bacterium]|jgi:thioredoxin reductase (NADPH)|nr:thioredoxin-disulfide reductase [Amoebophilaceae bacterium]
MDQAIENLLIIGSGPAGYTAAIYAARAGLAPILYQGTQPGGQLVITTDVENYPGYPEGVQGPQMMLDFQRQAQRFGTTIYTASVTAVDFATYPYQVTIDDQQTVRAKAVIIATGASAKWLGLPSEKRLNGKGVSACAVCDGFFFKGRNVAVVGGGDSAAEEASYLSKICNQVYMLVRKDKLRASAIMQQRVMTKPNIEILWHTEVEEVLGTDVVAGVCVVNNRTQQRSNIPIQGLFVAVGHQPNTTLFAPYLNLNPQGYIQTVPGTTQTNLPGVFAAGDVQDIVYRQAVTAAGTGCMAALDAERFLATQGD